MSAGEKAIFTSHFVAALFVSRDAVDDRRQRLSGARLGSGGGGGVFHVSVIVNKNPPIYHEQHFISASLDSGARQAEDGDEDEWRFDFQINAA